MTAILYHISPHPHVGYSLSTITEKYHMTSVTLNCNLNRFRMILRNFIRGYYGNIWSRLCCSSLKVLVFVKGKAEESILQQQRPP